MNSENDEAHSGPAAIIDIGSNTIKLLVAGLNVRNRRVHEYCSETLETRISTRNNGLFLSPEAMEMGVHAVKNLLEKALPFHPVRTIIAATSAVREASNQLVFARKIKEATGIPLRVLSGDDEAIAIGRGVSLDPYIKGEPNFYLFDLGGGSMECLEFSERAPTHAVSLPLGAVRLTHQFLPDPNSPFSNESRVSIEREVKLLLSESCFPFSLPDSSPVVGTGGTLAVTRAILAARAGQSIKQGSPLLPVKAMEELLLEIAPLSLNKRRSIEGLPHGRADVFPAALTVLLSVAALARAKAFIHSFYNLRYGLIEEALSII